MSITCTSDACPTQVDVGGRGLRLKKKHNLRIQSLLLTRSGTFFSLRMFETPAPGVKRQK